MPKKEPLRIFTDEHIKLGADAVRKLFHTYHGNELLGITKAANPAPSEVDVTVAVLIAVHNSVMEKKLQRKEEKRESSSTSGDT